MPDLTFIEGGAKPRDRQAELARQAFTELLVCSLRSLLGARSEYKAVRALQAFIDHSALTATPPGVLIGDALSEMHRRAFCCEDFFSTDSNVRWVAEEALPIVFEAIASDKLAPARRQKRFERLDDAIINYVRGEEERARQAGWSWVMQATTGLAPIARPRKERNKRRSGSTVHDDSPDLTAVPDVV